MSPLTRFRPRIVLSSVCLILLALAAPARAGTWAITISGTDTVQAGVKKAVTATLPITGTNGASVASGEGDGNPGTTVTATASASLTVKGTWQPTGGNATADPAPPSIVLSESVTAYAEGTASTASGSNVTTPGSVSDGLGDNPPQNQTTGQVVGQAYPTESGGSFSVSLTIQASASATPGPSYTQNGLTSPGTCSVSGGIGPVTISIHAQPYNFHITSDSASSNGTLSFMYDWSSTDGNVADLTTCYWHQYVTYPGPNPYIPPLPFYLTDASGNPAQLKNPTVNADSNMATTVAGDTQLVWGSIAPYSNKSVPAQQQWQFDDSATGQTNILIPGPDSNVTITRTIGPRPPYTSPWWFSVTKSGLTAWLPLQ